MNDMEQIKKQHLNTYKNATKEIVINNTKALVENDIISLIKKPPLDSMDIIKTKLITIDKKEKIILSTEKLDTLIKNYRDFLEDKLLSLRKNKAVAGNKNNVVDITEDKKSKKK